MKAARAFVVALLIVLGAAVAATAQDRQTPAPPSSQELAAIIAANDADTYVVDVRTPQEYESGAIPSAINIPYDQLAENLPTQDRSARIVVYCRSGNRSSIARSILEELGFHNVLDFGGIYRWQGELVKP